MRRRLHFFLNRHVWALLAVLLTSLTLQAMLQGAEPRLDRLGDPLPPGAVLRLGTERFRHRHNSIMSPAFFPDGKVLAYLNGHDSLKLFEADTGRVRAEIHSEDLLLLSCAVTPDGKKIVATGVFPHGEGFALRTALRVWDAASFKEIKTIHWPEPAFPNKLLLMPKGSIAVTADLQSIRLWDLEGMAALPSYPLGEVTTITMSADGSLIAFADPQNGDLILWEWQTKKPARRISMMGIREVISLALSSDAKTIAVGTDNGALLWDVETGKAIRQFLPTNRLHVWNLAFMPDDKYLVMGGDDNRQDRDFNGVCVWETATGKLARHLRTPGEGVSGVAVSPDGTRLAASTNGSVHVWDTKNWQELGPREPAHRSWVGGMSMSANGLILTGSDDHTARLWDLTDGKPLHVFHGGSWLRDVAISPDGKHAAALANNDKLLVWDTTTGRSVFQLPGHGRHSNFNAAAITEDGKRLLSFGDDFRLRITDLANGKALAEHDIRPGGIVFSGDNGPGDALPLEQMAFSRRAFSVDGQRFIWTGGDNFHVFDVNTGKERLSFPNPVGTIHAMTLSADSQSLLTGASSRSIPIKLPNGQIEHTNPKEQLLNLWEIDTGKAKFSARLEDGHIRGVAMAPNGKSFAVSHVNSKPQILLFEVGKDKPHRNIGLPSPPAGRMLYTPDGKRLVCALEDSTVLVFDVQAPKAE